MILKKSLKYSGGEKINKCSRIFNYAHPTTFRCRADSELCVCILYCGRIEVYIKLSYAHEKLDGSQISWFEIRNARCNQVIHIWFRKEGKRQRQFNEILLFNWLSIECLYSYVHMSLSMHTNYPIKIEKEIEYRLNEWIDFFFGYVCMVFFNGGGGGWLEIPGEE